MLVYYLKTCSDRFHPQPCKFIIRIFFIIILSVVRLSPHGTAATIGLLYQPQMTGDGDGSNWWNED
jgi:hypothetical protein